MKRTIRFSERLLIFGYAMILLFMIVQDLHGGFRIYLELVRRRKLRDTRLCLEIPMLSSLL